MKKTILKFSCFMILSIPVFFPTDSFAQFKNIIENIQKTSLEGVKTLLNQESGLTDDVFHLPPVKDPFLKQLPKKEKIVESPAQNELPATPTPRPSTITTPPLAVKPPVEAKPPSLNITGLVWNSKEPQAIINGKVLRVGQKVDDVTITDIQKNKVTVSRDGKNFTILYNP